MTAQTVEHGTDRVVGSPSSGDMTAPAYRWVAMAEIEAECPACGTVRVNSARWRLVVYPQAADRSFCEFRCGCEQVVVVRATPIIIAALQHIVPLTVEHIPQEALEAHDGEAINEDDYIAFMRELTELP